MIFTPKLDDGWICSEYISYRNVSADLSIVKQHIYIKGDVILKSYEYALNSFPADQVKAAGKAASWKFDWKFDTNKHHIYFITYYKSEDSDSVLACIDCNCLPQLMIDKKTGKFYCTCPSSFIGVEDDKIPEIGEPDENGYVLIHKDKPTFDTIEEAIEAWNNEQRFQKTYQKLVEEYCSKNGEMSLEEIINFITKYAADDGNSDNHQLFVIENPNEDPFEGEFVFKGRISTDKDDNWAIDGSLFEHNGELYMVWSGWQTRRVDTETQCIYIAKMENPWTLASERVLISKPELDWERNWKNENGWNPAHIVYVNEGPQPLKSPDGKLVHIVYSASGVWTPYYSLGMLTADADADLLDPASWKKSSEPVFTKSPENGVYGTGHNFFFKSPDGTEYYLIYHARSAEVDLPGMGDMRSPRIQKFDWTEDGYPVFGTPLPTRTWLAKPSGTPQN